MQAYNDLKLSTILFARIAWRWLQVLLALALLLPIGAASSSPLAVPQLRELRGLDDDAVLRGRVALEAVVEGVADRAVFWLEGPREARYTVLAPPYTLFGQTETGGWDTASWPDGRYTLTTWACLDEHCSTLRRRFFVANSGVPQLLDLIGAPADQRLRGHVRLGANVAGAADEVIFSLDGPRQAIHKAYSPPYIFTPDDDLAAGWDTSHWPDGPYMLTVEACLQGQCARSDQRLFVANEGDSVATMPPFVVNPTPDEVAFQPPRLERPVQVVLSDANPRYVGDGNDAVVIVESPMTVPAKIENVRNFVMVGAEFTIAAPLPATRPFATLSENLDVAHQHKALSLQNISGVGYLEGVYINGTNGNMSEGIQIWGASTGRIVIVNSRIEGAHTTPDDLVDAIFNHCDLIQLMAGSLYLRNVTLRDSDFQGVYMNAEHGNVLGFVRAQRVNISDVRRQAWFLNQPDRDGEVWLEARELWNDQTATSRYVDSPRFPFLPKPETVSDAAVRWQDNPTIQPGTIIRRGTPPNGDFAPAEYVGTRYDRSFFE
jgi:hypothetical protein